MIVAARLDGLSFWEIPENRFRMVTDEIILATSSITAASLPETELMAKYLSDEIIRMIVYFGYDVFTVEEIKTAVRINMRPFLRNPGGDDLNTIDPPHRVSVSFLAAVLRNYFILRCNIDRMIENKINGF